MHEGPEGEPAWETVQDPLKVPEGTWAHIGQSSFADIGKLRSFQSRICVISKITQKDDQLEYSDHHIDNCGI